MTEQNIKINQTQAQLLQKYKDFGFKNKDELINYALRLLQKEIERNIELKASADLYAKLYEEDKETQSLTESAIYDWD